MRHRKLLLVSTFILFASNSYAKDHAHWAYDGSMGPEKWGKLSEEFATCAIGKQQSPIDIPSDKAVQKELPPLQFDYQPITLGVQNNGHTIYVAADKGGKLTLDKQSYSLAQFHFHTPSEEAIDGKRADMVAHFVHKNDKDELLVVALFLNQGAANAELDKIWQVLPKKEGELQQHAEISIDMTKLLPESKQYYSFTGSLTTPPCTESVKWVVLKSPVTLSTEQLKTFQTLYPHNARPLQPVGEREIAVSK